MRQNEMCEPCGECQWCESNFIAKAKLKKARARIRRLKQLLEKAKAEIESELFHVGSDEWPKHPGMRAKARLCDRIEKELAKP